MRVKNTNNAGFRVYVVISVHATHSLQKHTHTHAHTRTHAHSGSQFSATRNQAEQHKSAVIDYLSLQLQGMHGHTHAHQMCRHSPKLIWHGDTRSNAANTAAERFARRSGGG